MLRMEVACFVIMVYISILYFSAKRENTPIHKTFTVLLVMLMVHLIFDGLTLYTVNHLDTVPKMLNIILHRFYTGTMLVVESMYTKYIMLTVEDEIKIRKDTARTFLRTMAIFYIVGAIVLPMTITLNPNGNYESGPLAWEIYCGTIFYLAVVVFICIRCWNRIQKKKRFVIVTALSVEIIAICVQGLFPAVFISGLGLTVITLSIYLTIENPDVQLLNRVNEEKKRAEEANASKSAMVSIVSHEIRTPMNAVVGMTDLLLSEDLTEKQRTYMENVKRSAASLVLIVNDLLDQSKIEAGKMELVDEPYEVETLLGDVRLIIENRVGDKDISVLYEIGEDVPKVLIGDAIKLRQVLINLMNNAVKFTEKGYIKLKIVVRQKEERKLQLRFEVEDSGQGIAKADQEKLFQAFSQVDIKKNHSKEGTGLGLSISKNLITLMGGKLDVISEYGKGSTFYFTITQDIPEEDCGVVEKMPEYKEFTAEGARILVVDDTEINRTIVKESLKPLKIRVDVIDSGIKALKMIQKVNYDVVFMDYLMPSMDGLETTKKIRELGESEERLKLLSVIAMTGDISKETREKFKQAGINGYLEKPVQLDKMKQLLAEHLPKELVLWQDN